MPRCPSPIAIILLSGAACAATTDEPRSIAGQPQALAPRPAGSCEYSDNCGHVPPGTGAGAGPGLGPAAAATLALGHVHRAASGPWPAGLLRGCGRLGLRASAAGRRMAENAGHMRARMHMPRRPSWRIFPLTTRDLRASTWWVVKTTRGL